MALDTRGGVFRRHDVPRQGIAGQVGGIIQSHPHRPGRSPAQQSRHRQCAFKSAMLTALSKACSSPPPSGSLRASAHRLGAPRANLKQADQQRTLGRGDVPGGDAQRSRQSAAAVVVDIVYMGMGDRCWIPGRVDSVGRITARLVLPCSPSASPCPRRASRRRSSGSGRRGRVQPGVEPPYGQRREIQCINHQQDEQPHAVLAEALRHFVDKTGTRPTFEFIVFKDFNGSLEDAGTGNSASTCHHQFDWYNPIDDGEFQQTTPEHLVTLSLLENET